MFLVPEPCPTQPSRGDAQGRHVVEDEPGEALKLPPDARLDSLDERLDRLQQAEARKARKRQGDPSWRAGQMVLSHLVGAPLGAGIVGWLLDRWLGTRPWLMLALLFVGFAVGVWDVLRISKTTPGGGSGTGS
jgi:ATP synthase protein I